MQEDLRIYKVYEIQNIGKGVITDITPDNLLPIYERVDFPEPILQGLQSVLNVGSSAIMTDMTLNIENHISAYEYTKIASTYQFIELVEVKDDGSSAQIDIRDTKISLNETTDSGVSTTLTFNVPTKNTELRLPAKTVNGLYTLATEDQIRLNIDQVLAEGNTATNKSLFMLNGNRVVNYNGNYIGGSINGLSTNQLNINDRTASGLAEYSFNPTKVDGEYIIATLDDIPTEVIQDLKSVLDAGNTVEYDNGNSQVQLLEGGVGNKESFIYSGDDNMSAGLSVIKDNVAITGFAPSDNIQRQGFIQVNNCMPKLVYVVDYNTSQKATVIEFNTPVVSTNIKFPAKSTVGNYTLATLDDIPVIPDSTNKQKNITRDYLITADDNNYSIKVNNGSIPITITFPIGLPINFFVGITQKGTGDVSLVGSSGVTLTNLTGLGYKIQGAGYAVGVEQLGTTNTFDVLGNTKVS